VNEASTSFEMVQELVLMLSQTFFYWDKQQSPDSVAIGNPERHMRKASHCGSKQQ